MFLYINIIIITLLLYCIFTISQYHNITISQHHNCQLSHIRQKDSLLQFYSFCTLFYKHILDSDVLLWSNKAIILFVFYRRGVKPSDKNRELNWSKQFVGDNGTLRHFECLAVHFLFRFIAISKSLNEIVNNSISY